MRGRTAFVRGFKAACLRMRGRGARCSAAGRRRFLGREEARSSSVRWGFRRVFSLNFPRRSRRCRFRAEHLPEVRIWRVGCVRALVLPRIRHQCNQLKPRLASRWFCLVYYFLFYGWSSCHAGWASTTMGKLVHM